MKLSSYEFEVLQDKAFFYAKHRIVAQWQAFLEDLHTQLLAQSFPITNHGKISKGDNYQQLPYMVLDYPSILGKEDIFAFRNIFLWGEGLVSTWVFQGSYKTEWQEKIIQLYPMLIDLKVHLQYVPELWTHEINDKTNFAVNQLSKEVFVAQLNELSFIKLSRFFPFKTWEDNPMKEILTYFKTITHSL